MSGIVQKDEKAGKVLREIATPVDFVKENKTLPKMLDDMREAMFSQSDGVALAAPQIGLSKRIFVVNPMVYREETKYKGPKELTFINPKITKTSRDKKLMEEGCLSVRPLYGKVRRSSRVTIEAYDSNGVKFEITGSGLLAQVFQHETDHLDGVLFVDKAKELYEIGE
jgi:peptide deformylase